MTSRATENWEVFLRDPRQLVIPNLGVTKVAEPTTPDEWATLRFELSSFVCEGEYRRGLDLILSTYLDNLSKPEQPAAWVSGFYGSGKSHLVRVLEYLWRDVRFPDGATARGITPLPDEIQALLTELTTVGRRAGGLWSAAGTLGAGAGDSVRLALLGIIFRAAELPEQYAPARFLIWLKQNGYDEAVRNYVEAKGKRFERELNNLYVSPLLAEAILAAMPGFASDAARVRELLREQFPVARDITNEALLRSIEDVLELESSTPGKLPGTLLVLDELQQFIGEDSDRTRNVQEVVEACSARFQSQILFVATGQAALQATPQLSKLQGRFTVRVTLSDTDVDRVVRKVVLQKAPDRELGLREVLAQASGEIDRQLVGTKIGPVPEDAIDLAPDYPLLPTRRRFWESVLRAVDSGGTAAQLRSQLQIVLQTTRNVAEQPLGYVVPGDAIYDQIKTGMLQSGILLREVARVIAEQDDDTPDSQLRSRLCAAIFLIGKLPTVGIAATGLRATPTVLADLLVADLRAGSMSLRQRIPELLNTLVESGTLMLVDDEYRLQTREGAQWEGDYRARYTANYGDAAKIAEERTSELRNAVGAKLKGVTLVQGASKTPRRLNVHVGTDAPPSDGTQVPVWARDGWSISERTVVQEAQQAGPDSPTVFVFLPQRDSDQLRAALAGYLAAKGTVEARGMPTTPEGIEARAAMESRVKIERGKLDGVIAEILKNARVFQGGGNEVYSGTLEGDLAEAVKAASENALVRMFPKFAMADHANWGKVIERVHQGAGDALTAVGYTGDVEKAPTCVEIRAYLGTAGKKGSDVRKRFTGSGYGWPQDAVDGSLLVLVQAGLVRASRNGMPLTASALGQAQIPQADLASEGAVVTVSQRIAARGLLTRLGISFKQGEETQAIPQLLSRLADLAQGAGGEPPLPARPVSAALLDDLQGRSGNDQLIAIAQNRTEIESLVKNWTDAKAKIADRLPRWQILLRLLRHAQGLPVAETVKPQIEAIQAQRSLLNDPDPLPTLTAQLADAVRAALRTAREEYGTVRDREWKNLADSEIWQQTPESERQRTNKAYNLEALPPLGVGTDAALLAALDASALDAWRTRIDALPSRFAKAREDAAKLLVPKAVTVRPPPATLRTLDDVDDYLARLKNEILAYLAPDRPVII